MLDVLGLDPLADPWRAAASGADHTHEALDTLVSQILEDRAAARAAKDRVRADALRNSRPSTPRNHVEGFRRRRPLAQRTLMADNRTHRPKGKKGPRLSYRWPQPSPPPG